MELLSRSLASALQIGRLPLPVAIALALDVLRGLVYAHAHGVLHRDIKPENILLRDDGTPVLTNFGFAQHLARGNQPGDAGTPVYLAPEQIRGGPIDARTDLYAVGVVLYQLVTGRLPFEGTDPQRVMSALLHIAPIMPSDYAPAIPPALNDLILRLLAKSPNQRLTSANAALQTLE